MSLFGALDTAASGVHLGRTWMDAVSHNVANVNTIKPGGEEPFRARLIVADSLPGTRGVRVSDVVEAPGPPDVAYDPDNPLADDQGYVTRPKVDLSQEMTNLMMASRLYQVNLSVMTQARDAYQSALQIGRR